MQLMINKLLSNPNLGVPHSKLLESIYLLRGSIRVRLFNNREHLATVPALFPNLISLKKQYSEYTNVMTNAHDYKKGKMTTNRKVDLVIADPLEALTALNLDISDIRSFDDDNTTTI